MRYASCANWNPHYLLTLPQMAPTRLALLEVAHEVLVARASRALAAQLSALCDAIDLHAIDHDGLPTDLAQVAGAASVRDPWGHPFLYVQPAVRRSHHRYDLCSPGPDGLPGSPDDICHR